MMEILQEDNEKKGRFFIKGPTGDIAEIVYNYVNPLSIIVEHTEVDPSLKGQGVGNRLVDSVVVWARASGIKVIPLCPFAKKVFERNEGYQDVLSRN